MKLKKWIHKRRRVDLPTLGAIAATRGILGLGAGLLLASRVPKNRRKPVGWALFGVGALSTLPLAARVLHR
ncbi:MAG: hypothetical protein R2991_04630 [Thermoanaerobaculia bacterium]